MEFENIWNRNYNSHEKKILGQRGEDFICLLYQWRGWSVLGKNIRTPYAELDLVFSKGHEILVVEVKTKSEFSKNRFLVLSWTQKQRLHRAMMWMWQKNYRSFKKVRFSLWLVTQCAIEEQKMPLIYDRN